MPFWSLFVPAQGRGLFCKCLKRNGGDDETRTRDLCRDRYHDLETQVLTGSSKEHKVVKTRRRELLLFPDCSHDAASDSETKLADGLAPTCGEEEITWRWFYKELRECPNAAEVLVEPSSLLATNGATSSTNAGNYASL